MVINRRGWLHLVRTRIVLMRKRKFIIVLLALCYSVSGYSLSSFFEISGGGGWSSLGYGLKSTDQPALNVSQNGSYGFNAHIGYGLQFTRNIGVGIGVDFARYGATAKIGGQAIWQGVTDTEGEMYNHIALINKWTDRQEIYMLEIPLSLYVRFPIATDVRIYGQIGAKACLPMIGKAHYSGSISHQGEYEPWMMTLTNIPNHGFYTSTVDRKYDLQMSKFTMAAFVKIGIEAPVDELRYVWIFGAITGSMHFMPAISSSPSATIGWRNDTSDETMRQAHSFMSDYTSILNTTLISGHSWPCAVGAEIGIRLRIPHAKRYRSHCRCEEE